MREMPFSLQGKGVLEVEEIARSYWSNSSNKGKKGEGLEPRSVLENRRSPSPPTSTSTLSSSLGGGGGGGSSDTAGVAALSDANNTHKWSLSGPTNSAGEQKEEWASELQPIPATALEMGGEKCGLGVDDWEAMLSESAASPGQELTFLRWIMGDIDDSAVKQQHLISQAPVEFDSSNSGLGFGGLVDPGFGFDAIGGSSVSAASAVTPPPPLAPSSQPATHLSANKAPSFSNPTINPIFLQPVPNSLPMFFPEPMEEKPHLFNPGLVLNHHQLAQPPQNPAFFLPLQPDHHLILPPHPKRHHSISADQISHKISFHQSFPQQQPPIPYHLQLRLAKPKDEAAAAVQQQQAIVDQLFKVAELIEAGNSVSTCEILARLNHQLPPSPIGLKPLLRSAFYFKEILHLLSNTPNPTPTPLATPWEVVLKLSAYKAFSEISPLLHFTNFTCTQTLLEELGGFDRIHIIDFDIGIGGQWSSFMQELAHRRSPAIPFLKITAFVSLSSHTLELHLTHDNLYHFAADLNIPFEFTIHSIESFDPNELLATVPANEAIAVNLPIGPHYTPSFPSLIRLVKQLNPKIVVSVDQGCDRSDLSFSHHFLHSFQSCLVLLDSIDAVGTNPDVASMIERLLVQPRVESAMMGRHRATDKMHPWRTLFASAGFVPVQFSNFTETQAECLLKRVQVRGFHVEKRQASLFLYWQRGELGSVSAWRC